MRRICSQCGKAFNMTAERKACNENPECCRKCCDDPANECSGCDPKDDE